MLKLYDVLSATADSVAPFTGRVRVVAFSGDGVGVWLAPLPDAAGCDYAKMPVYRTKEEVGSWLANLQAVVQAVVTPAMWLMSDKLIRETLKQTGQGRPCAALVKRDFDWDLIKELVEAHSTAEILDRRLFFRWARRRARAKRVSLRRLYRILNQYWAGGCNMNALIPGYTQRAANKKPRKMTSKLGRPNAAVRAGQPELAGFIINEEAIKKLQFGWKHYKTRGTSTRDAFLETAAVFWREDVQKVSGKLMPVLLPAHARPSEDQFRYWGPRGEGNKEAWVTQLGSNEWERNHRPLPGSVRDGVVASGQVATLDAVSGDVQLVSIVSRLKPVGLLTRITVLDSDLGYVAGFYAGFDAPSGATALQAIANAADDKVAFCARYDIEITPEQWYAMAFKRYLADNGELRNEKSMDALTAWSASIEYARSGRAELKHVESDHHSAQAKVDHKLPGTTLGRRAQRGEKDPVLTAALNHYEYVRQHIKRVLYHNNEAKVPELLTLEMRRDGVTPTRAAILRWKMANGYWTQFQPPVEVLRARLLPQFRAVINGRGLFIMRPDRGNKNELVRGARFVSDYLLQSGRMERGRAKSEPVVVNADPNDLSRVWLPTREGLMELPNVHPDSLLISRATLADVLDIQDDDGMEALLGKSETDQKAVEFNVDRDTEAQAAVKARAAEIRAAGGAPSGLSLKRYRRAHRTLEKEMLQQQANQAPAPSTSVAPTPPPPPQAPEAPAAAVPAPVPRPAAPAAAAAAPVWSARAAATAALEALSAEEASHG